MAQWGVTRINAYLRQRLLSQTASQVVNLDKTDEVLTADQQKTAEAAGTAQSTADNARGMARNASTAAADASSAAQSANAMAQNASGKADNAAQTATVAQTVAEGSMAVANAAKAAADAATAALARKPDKVLLGTVQVQFGGLIDVPGIKAPIVKAVPGAKVGDTIVAAHDINVDGFALLVPSVPSDGNVRLVFVTPALVVAVVRTFVITLYALR